jgi:hypothetical protein
MVARPPSLGTTATGSGFCVMARTVALALFLLAGCSKSQNKDLQYIKQSRSLAAEWALVNEQANSGRLTTTYVVSMRHWLHDDLQTAYSSLTQPNTQYGQEMRSLVAEPQDAASEVLKSHGAALKHLEEGLESA